MTTIWTIGHSNHEWATFEALLAASGISVLVDVRSKPSSRFAHFNAHALKAHLEVAHIAYFHMGDTLGGRPRSGETADYELMARSPELLHGIDRVHGLASRARVCLMCSEHEPLECHRCLLVGRRLAEQGVRVEHILRGGRIEPHAETEDRLLKMTGEGEDDLFVTREQRLAKAYREQNQRLWRPRARQPVNRR